VFRDVSYILDEEGYATAEYQDLARKRFIKAWEGLIDGYKVIRLKMIWMYIPHHFHKETLSDGNYRLFIGFALDVLLKPWERFVMGLKYTEVCPPIGNVR
jgi:hypothetical protein